MGLSNFIKKLIETNTIWGVRAKKLAGINDFANITTTSVVMSSIDNSIDFAPNKPPAFIKANSVGQFIRIIGGANDSGLFEIISIVGTKVITLQPLVNDSGVRTLSARLWQIHDDTSISKSSSTGSTIYNVHNRNTTGLDDASAVALTFAEHYHDDPATEEDNPGELLSHEYNELGCKNLVRADCCDMPYIELGPQMVFEDEGNVLKAVNDENGVCT